MFARYHTRGYTHGYEGTLEVGSSVQPVYGPTFHPATFQIHLKNVQIIGGVAYLRKDNVMVMGGAVASLQALHQLRLYEELRRRMDEDETEAEVRSTRLSPSRCDPIWLRG